MRVGRGEGKGTRTPAHVSLQAASMVFGTVDRSEIASFAKRRQTWKVNVNIYATDY
jgi:hypothetical protein